MNEHIIVYYDRLTDQVIKNIIYKNLSKANAIQQFEEEFGIDEFPIINVISL